MTRKPYIHLDANPSTSNLPARDKFQILATPLPPTTISGDTPIDWTRMKHVHRTRLEVLHFADFHVNTDMGMDHESPSRLTHGTAPHDESGSPGLEGEVGSHSIRQEAPEGSSPSPLTSALDLAREELAHTPEPTPRPLKIKNNGERRSWIRRVANKFVR